MVEMGVDTNGDSNLDAILTEVGGFGLFQIITYALICIPNIISAATYVNFMLSATTLDYRWVEIHRIIQRSKHWKVSVNPQKSMLSWAKRDWMELAVILNILKKVGLRVQISSIRSKRWPAILRNVRKCSCKMECQNWGCNLCCHVLNCSHYCQYGWYKLIKLLMSALKQQSDIQKCGAAAFTVWIKHTYSLIERIVKLVKTPYRNVL